MNTQVSRTAPILTPKKSSKSLAEIRKELIALSNAQKLTVVGGVVFRIRKRKKLCGNIVPE